jgi:DNA polymerase
MKELRGKTIEKEGKKIMVTYHPAAILRNPNLRPLLEQDIQKVSSM